MIYITEIGHEIHYCSLVHLALFSIICLSINQYLNKSLHIIEVKEEFAQYITISYVQPLTTCSNAVGNHVSSVESLGRTWKTSHNLVHNVRYVKDLIRTLHAWRERTDVRGRSWAKPQCSAPLSFPDAAVPTLKARHVYRDRPCENLARPNKTWIWSKKWLKVYGALRFGLPGLPWPPGT